MDFIKKFAQLTAVLFLVGFVLGLEHNDAWLNWLVSMPAIASSLRFLSCVELRPESCVELRPDSCEVERTARLEVLRPFI